MNAVDGIEIRSVSESELATFVDIHNAYWDELSVSLEQLMRDDAELRPDQREYRWLSWRGTKPVGFAFVQKQIGGDDGYWYMGGGVLLEDRQQGIGDMLYQQAIAVVEPTEWIKVSTQIRESELDAIQFANHRGFVEQKRDFFAVLDLDQADFPLIDVRGIRFATFEDLDSDRFRRRFHELFEEVRKDVPRANPPKRFEFEEFESIVLGDPKFLKWGSYIAMDGDRPIGFSGLFDNVREGYVDQWLTAVSRPYRGRDIAKAIKVHQIAWLKQRGYKHIQTDNDSRNEAMLAINDWMGFKRQLAILSMAKSRV